MEERKQKICGERRKRRGKKKGLDMKALGPDEKVFQRSAWMKSHLIQKICRYPA